METRLVLFVALVFLVLFWNTLLLWFVYRALARSTDRFTRYQRHCSQLIKGMGIALEKAELASHRAAGWSGQIRERALEAGGNVDRAENWLGYGMAKLDFTVDRVSKEITGGVDRINATVSAPLLRTATVVHGIKAFLELLSLSQPDPEGRRHRS